MSILASASVRDIHHPGMLGIDERIDEDVFQRSGHTEKMEKSRNAIRVHKEESSSRSSAKNTH